MDPKLIADAQRKLREMAHRYAALARDAERFGDNRSDAAAASDLYLAALAYAHVVFRPKKTARILARKRKGA